MTSPQDEAGPSGLAIEEILASLGLETSDSEKEEDHPFTSDKDHEEMGDSDKDDLCQEVLDRFERQRAFQSQLLEQSGGGGVLDDAEGTFDFELDPYVDRLSSCMGVRERHFKTQLRQRGNFIGQQKWSVPYKRDYVER